MTDLERKLILQSIELAECKADAERWRAMLPRVRMMMDVHGAAFYVRGAADPAKDCSVAEHFTAAIDAVQQEKS